MGSLDEAWSKVVAALPEDYYAGIYFDGWGWVATYNQKFSECEKCGILHQCRDIINQDEYFSACGNSPEDALTNLATRVELRNKHEDTSPISGNGT
jgi:hypothetical protein